MTVETVLKASQPWSRERFDRQWEPNPLGSKDFSFDKPAQDIGPDPVPAASATRWPRVFPGL